MSGFPLFLSYQLAKAQVRATVLDMSPVNSKTGSVAWKRKLPQEVDVKWLKKTNPDALLWVHSLINRASLQQRRDLAEQLKTTLDEQEIELDKRVKAAGSASKGQLGLWARLCFRFAGLSTLLFDRNVGLFLGVVLSLTLMVTSLAAMTQAGMLAAGSWVLGNTLTSAALWLAAQLSITALGPTGLIVLATLGAWLAATLIVEWKFRGTIENAFFGLTKEGTEESGVYQSNRAVPELIGEIEQVAEDRLSSNPFFYLVLPLFMLNWLFDVNKSAEENEAARPSSRPFAFIKGLLHFVLAALAMPFMALAVIADSFVLALQLGWGLFCLCFSTESSGASFSLAAEPAELTKSETLRERCLVFEFPKIFQRLKGSHSVNESEADEKDRSPSLSPSNAEEDDEEGLP